jgi:hypothetical protein
VLWVWLRFAKTRFLPPESTHLGLTLRQAVLNGKAYRSRARAFSKSREAEEYGDRSGGYGLCARRERVPRLPKE